MRAINLYGTCSKTIQFLICFVLISLIGFIRYLTGPELALSLFYLFPITFVAWSIGRWGGIFMSFASAISWLLADMSMLHKFSSAFVPYLNESFRLIVFVIISNIIFELKKALIKQRDLARTDTLTGISNRRAFFEYVNLELNKSRRYKYPISMLYLDIDNFKEINDRFGHNAGDTLLCLVANTLKSNIRVIDIVARIGGDEFGIVIAQADKNASYSVAHKILKKLSGLIEVNGWPVTFSMGLVIYEKTPNSVDDILIKADSLMYDAKKNNKNKIRHEVISDLNQSCGYKNQWMTH